MIPFEKVVICTIVVFFLISVSSIGKTDLVALESSQFSTPSSWNIPNITPNEIAERFEATHNDTTIKTYPEGPNSIVSGDIAWSQWQSLSGLVNSNTSPVVARNFDGRLEVFVVGADNQLYHKWQTSTPIVQLDLIGASASSNNNGINNSSNVIDGDLSTRWSASGEQWIELDLGSNQIVKRVDVFWHLGSSSRIASFDIKVINDEAGTSNSVLGEEGMANSSTLINEPDGFTGNRVKLFGHGNSQNEWNSILEIQVWGTKLDDDPRNLVHLLTPSESRTIIPIQMQLPNGEWSDPIEFNFDNGASWATDVPPELLKDFGSGPDGVPSDEREEQPAKIRIDGLAGEYTIPVVIQDKAHYDLFKEQPPPERYPLLRFRDLLPLMSFVFTNETTIIRTDELGPPREIDNPQKIILPDMSRRSETPTSGWQWMKVRFENPSDSAKSIVDWFALNTGDKRMIIKKSLADSIDLSLSPGRNADNFDTISNFEFIEAEPVLKLENVKTEARNDSARFARGGDPRNFGGGLEVLDRYSMIFWDSEMHRALIPTIPP